MPRSMDEQDRGTIGHDLLLAHGAAVQRTIGITGWATQWLRARIYDRGRNLAAGAAAGRAHAGSAAGSQFSYFCDALCAVYLGIRTEWAGRGAFDAEFSCYDVGPGVLAHMGRQGPPEGAAGTSSGSVRTRPFTSTSARRRGTGSATWTSTRRCPPRSRCSSPATG